MHSTARALTKVRPHRLINTTKYLKPTVLPRNKFHTSSTMSMFGPRFYSPAEPNFTGLFRLIDDFDKYALQNSGNGAATQQGGRHGRHLPTFTPKFDLKETETAFELHGELPGIEKENVNIEFTDPQTIVVRGRVERTYTQGTPPAGLLGEQSKGAIQDKEHHEKAPKPTVEDEKEEGAQQSTVAETDKNKAAAEQNKQQQQPQHKFWVSERSVGEFSRTFTFPSRVDTDNVTASLNNGILSVVVPKSKKPEGRRITIN
ncbi:HSP20-like chaperone [Hypoxylon sp. FL0543]|nr:HSP20-like chaperone [Hypoxylon sp. FL0543]